MAWEWVAPAGTAAVGVTSVVVTFAASRSAQAREERAAARQRRYAIEDALRQERKETYRAFLSAVTDVENAVKALYLTPEGDDVTSASTAVLDTFHVVVNQSLELDLVAGSRVSEAAGELTDDIDTLTSAVLKDASEARMVSGDAVQRLIAAMADELRLESPAP